MASEKARAFRVAGMDCAEEIATLRREVGPVVGGVLDQPQQLGGAGHPVHAGPTHLARLVQDQLEVDERGVPRLAAIEVGHGERDVVVAGDLHAPHPHRWAALVSVTPARAP